MEDRTTTIVTGQNAFFGVYDGHGGYQAAEFCQDNLHKNLMKEMNMQWRGETPQLRTTDSEAVRKISHCIREAFVTSDHQFLCSTQRPQGGTTAVVAVIVNGEEFCLTRAIGDTFVKVPAGYDFRDMSAPQVVTSEPEVSITELVNDDLFIILASDGVWDRMINEDAVQFVYHSLRTTAQQDPQIAAQELANHAIFNLRSTDNVSVIIILPRKLNQCRPLNFQRNSQ